MAEGGKISKKCGAVLTMKQKTENTYIACIVDGQDLGVADGGKGGDNMKEEDNIAGSGRSKFYSGIN